ncbi:hypothetical protein SCHPADRAFT_710544 [Schizopora paradoxa]|uniref:DUF6533 domain-containing protein n=1 Tax=Schizopora paradoxa TaxID=27342 RepID=A0A0H2R3C0_9AGAM|nr:hypothetical protein SCHPADRAFT_710544 [Schizopora paradoxa]
MNQTAADLVQEFYEDAQVFTAAKHFIDASFAMLIYDHLLTFGDEVERVWKPKFTGATLLFLINRYFTPLQYIVNIASFFDAAWTFDSEACINFVKFPGAGTTCSIVVEIILIIRTYALYGGSNVLLAFLSVLFIIQISAMGMALSRSKPETTRFGLAGCILTGTDNIFAALWIAPLCMDSVICILTLWKTRQYIRDNVKTPILQVLRRDGILYFAVIFCANLLNVLIFSLAPENVKAIGARSGYLSFYPSI